MGTAVAIAAITKTEDEDSARIDLIYLEKLVAAYSKLDPAASVAKWEELDETVDKNIFTVAKHFETLAISLIKVRAFLSQLENPGRRAQLEETAGFPVDLTWTEYLNSKAEKLDMSTRTLRDKLAGFKLGLKGGKPASSVNRKPKQISAGTIPAGISQTQIDAQAKLNVAKATLADAHKQLDKTIAGGDINGQAAAVLAKHESDVAEAEIAAGVTTREIEIESEIVTVDWKSILVNLLATLKADKAADRKSVV